MKTIQEAKLYLRANFRKGCKCPCCNQRVQVYRRSINLNMVKALCYIYSISLKKGVEYIHVQKEFAELGLRATGMDYIQLARFGLISESTTETPNEGIKSSGMWKITQSGILFLNGKCSVPDYVDVYDNKTIGFSSTVKRIDQITKTFNYKELFNNS